MYLLRMLQQVVLYDQKHSQQDDNMMTKRDAQVHAVVIRIGYTMAKLNDEPVFFSI
jgi:hypothetical protein